MSHLIAALFLAPLVIWLGWLWADLLWRWQAPVAHPQFATMMAAFLITVVGWFVLAAAYIICVVAV